VALTVVLVGATAVPSALASQGPAPAQRVAGDDAVIIPAEFRGRSGRLRFHVLLPGEEPAEELAALWPEAPSDGPVILTVRDSLAGDLFRFATLVPLAAKQNGRLGVYRVGRWPAEAHRPRSPLYKAPPGLVEVQEADQSVPVSTHFTLGQFLTKDQRDVWPKFLVLDERLVDKLELIVSELRIAGHRSDGLTVLSGFRTPQHNARARSAGTATDSRHQYGDAADVFVDADGDGRMDDLNGDGRVDIRDALEFARIVDRVEAKYPELVGGVGLYRVVPGHGPFVHVDARGERARWGLP